MLFNDVCFPFGKLLPSQVFRLVSSTPTGSFTFSNQNYSWSLSIIQMHMNEFSLNEPAFTKMRGPHENKMEFPEVDSR